MEALIAALIVLVVSVFALYAVWHSSARPRDDVRALKAELVELRKQLVEAELAQNPRG